MQKEYWNIGTQWEYAEKTFVYSELWNYTVKISGIYP